MTIQKTTASLPEKGESPEQVLDRIRAMHKDDADWKGGRVWSLVYYADEVHDNLLKSAANELFSANYLNPLAFKSLHTMEQEVVHMTLEMLHAKEGGVGVMTSGGTESILAAMFCYRQRAKKTKPHAKRYEVIAPATIHPAFDKAAEMFGLHLLKAPVDAARRGQPKEMEKLISENTVLLLASAPSYPNGVLDPVEEIADLAVRHKLPFHVDACIGGFMLPWIEQLGQPVPLWDFRLNGVTSISADVHKFGFGAKGASVLMYRDMELMHHQFFVSTDFPGGIYISPTLMGTRPGGPIAAAWAGMRHFGRNGYLAMAGKLMRGAHKLRAGLSAIPNIEIVGDPCMNILSYTTVNNRPDIFVVADRLEEKGWVMDRQQFPDCIHLTVLPTNLPFIDEYLEDLREAVAYASEHKELAAKGNAAVYGMMARIPFRGVVENSVRKIMEEMFGETIAEVETPHTAKKSSVGENPKWIGVVSRLLSVWERRKRFFSFNK
jgi:glutamate/tyrosine decarboxylase-like PLP-dependent enzyme